jgi:CBS domain-containing protein
MCAGTARRSVAGGTPPEESDVPATISSITRTDSRPGDTGDHLDMPVRDIMTAGVVTIAEDASLRSTYRALVSHDVHAVLVVGRTGGTPLGWVTARGLLAWVESAEHAFLCARDAITERPQTISPSATARDALVVLAQAGVTHLLVAARADQLPEGVVGEFDLVRLAAA